MENWNDILYQNSSRQLLSSVSLSDDKLVALGGVAEEFSNFIHGSYLAGQRESRLCEQLLWACPEGLLLQPHKDNHFRRIGLFHRAGEAAFEYIKQEEITII